MINKETIQILSKKYQTTELNVLREYIQHLFLSLFYEDLMSKEIFFKGGTALRILYRSPRFSEDLDFSSSLKNIADIETLIISTLQKFEKHGIETIIQESKKTSGGYLGITLFRLRESTLSVQVEISLRQKKVRGDFMTLTNDFIPTYSIISLFEKDLVQEKIQALLTRQKPRDFYDLYFILRANLLPIEKRNVLTQILKLLNSTNIAFEKELRVFLPRNHWPLIRDFRRNLEREMNRYV